MERVKTLERMLSPSAIVGIDGNFVLAMGYTQFSDTNWDGGIHDSTLLAYTTLSNGRILKQVLTRSVKLLQGGKVVVELMTCKD